jgi:nucleoid DNA-binding protein
MVTTKSRAGKSNAGQAKSRAVRARLASQPRPPAKPAAMEQGDGPDMVIAGVSTNPEPAEATVPVPDTAEEAAPLFKKKQLVDRVHALSGGKKREVKDIVEATLAVIGEALASGESLVLPPLGKMTVNRQKDLASGEVMIVKIRRPGSGKASDTDADKDPLADDQEDG